MNKKQLEANEKYLKNKLRISEASSVSRLHDAHRDLKNCSEEKYTSSSLTITVKNINKDNTTVIEEFVINDGFSKELIEALKKDIKKSYDLKMTFNTIV